MIEETQTRPRRWARVALGLVALTTLSAGTGWGAAHLASPANAAPDLAKVRAALKLRLPKTPIDAINCSGLGGLCEVASKSTLFYVDARAKYLVIGRIYDMEARQDLTAARLLALNPDLLAAGAARSQAGSDEAPPQRAAAPKTVSLATNAAVIALLGFFEPQQVGLERGLVLPGRAVDPLQHLVA